MKCLRCENEAAEGFDICLKCKKRADYKKAWYEANKQEISERKKAFHLEHKDEISILNKARYLKNRESVLKTVTNYRNNNKEQIRIRKKKYAVKNNARLKANRKIYYLKNKERININSNKYQKDNRQTLTVKYRQYFEENKEKLQKQKSDWYFLNKETIKIKRRIYVKNNRNKIRSFQSQYRAKRRGVTNYKVDCEYIFKLDKYICRLCGKPTDPTVAPHHVLYPTLDHIIPISKGGAHDYDNLQCAHFGCNSSKGNRSHKRVDYVSV